MLYVDEELRAIADVKHAEYDSEMSFVFTEGFILNKDQQAFIFAKMRGLLEKMPIGSDLELRLFKIGALIDDDLSSEMYRGKLTVLSSHFSCRCEWTDSDIYYLFIELERDCKYQMERWNRKRFSGMLFLNSDSQLFA